MHIVAHRKRGERTLKRVGVANDVAITATTIRFGATAITLAESLAGHVRQLIADRRPRAAADIGDSSWLFSARRPGARSARKSSAAA